MWVPGGALCEPLSERRPDLWPGQQGFAPVRRLRADDKHPAGPEGVLVEQLRAALQFGVGRHDGAGEGCVRSTHPLSALYDREGPPRLENMSDTLRVKNEDFACKVHGRRCEAGAHRSILQCLVPDLIREI